MEFNLIHCSSRYGRSARSLEYATDTFYKKASIVTLTEVGSVERKRAPFENGWGYFNAQGASGFDECGIAWDLDFWTVRWKKGVKVSDKWRKPWGDGFRWPVVACTVFLKHKQTGHTCLVSVAHMPTKTSTASGFNPVGRAWAQRVAVYKQATRNWSTYAAQVKRTHNPDMFLIVADWNLNFRHQWVRRWVNGQFSEISAKHAWKHFTGSGTHGRSVIDAVLYTGCSTPHGSVVIHDPGDSTDHTPFITHFSRTAKPGTPGPGGEDDNAGGGFGTPWWNFEDYGDETLYKVEEA